MSEEQRKAKPQANRTEPETSPAVAPVSGLEDDERAEATLSTGYMGDPEAWCYWDSEYPDEGSCGPFSSRAEAAEHAVDAGYFVPPEAP